MDAAVLEVELVGVHLPLGNLDDPRLLVVLRRRGLSLLLVTLVLLPLFRRLVCRKLVPLPLFSLD